MLDFFRRSAQTKTMKFLLILLALTFLIWGFSGVISDSGGGIVAVQIGNYKVYEKEWNALLGQQILMRENLRGSKFTQEEINDPQFRTHILNMLINRNLVKVAAQNMNLIISDELAQQILADNYFFRTENGAFDFEKFQLFLKNSGKSEQQLFEDLKDDMRNRYLLDGLTSLYIYPPNMVDVLSKAYSAKHILDIYLLGVQSIAVAEEPSEVELKNILATRKEEFTAPEWRKISFITFNKDDVNTTITVSEDDIQNYYKANIMQFTQLEKRQVLQIVCSSQEEAEKVRKQVMSEGDFIKVALQYGDKEDVELGTLDRDSMMPNIAQVIFDLKVGDISEPIKTPLGWQVFKVVEIIEPTVQSLDEVRSFIKKQIIEQNHYGELNALAQSIDNDLVMEHSLEDIAENYGLQIERDEFSVGDVSSNDAKKDDLYNKIKMDAVALLQNEMSSVTYDADSGYYYVLYVDYIAPERLLDIAEVREQLVILWEEEKRAVQAQMIFDKLLAAIQGQQHSDVIAELINGYKIAVKSNVAITRDNLGTLPDDVGYLLLSLGVGQSSPTLYDVKTDSYIVAVAKDVVLMAQDSKKGDDIKDKITQAILSANRDVIFEQWLASLKEEYKIKVNQALIYRKVVLD